MLVKLFPRVQCFYFDCRIADSVVIMLANNDMACTICVTKTEAMISCAVDLGLCFRIYAKSGFLMTQHKYENM